MKNILLPTDFSENAWNAMQYAFGFFEKDRCTFYFLHASADQHPVLGPVSSAPHLPASHDTSLSVRDHLKKLVKSLKEKFPDSNHKCVLLADNNSLIESIKRQVFEKKIDMIVLGTRGAGGLKEMTIGSNTGEIIKRIKCPLLIIPERAAFLPVNAIVFPTDYRTFAPPHTLDTLIYITDMFGAHLRFLYVSKKSEKELDESQSEHKSFLKDYFENTRHSFHEIIGKSVEEALQTFSDEYETGLIAMVAKNLNFLQQLLVNPKVTRISYHTSIPFLVLHE